MKKNNTDKILEDSIDLCDDAWKIKLWQAIIDYQNIELITSGRGKRPGVNFSYSVLPVGGKCGKRYDGTCIDGYGNEIIILGHTKSISRSTVELAYKNAMMEQNVVGYVSGPKKLGVPGAGSYLFSIFINLGIIINHINKL